MKKENVTEEHVPLKGQLNFIEFLEEYNNEFKSDAETKGNIRDGELQSNNKP